MALDKKLFKKEEAAAAAAAAEQEGLILHLDANDVDSFDGQGDGTVWYDITDHEYTPATNVDEHFNTVLYTGDDSNDRAITGVGFQPDLVWIKNRDSATSHMLYDSVRGAEGSGGDHLSSDTTGTAGGAVTSLFDSFDTDGFTIDKASSSRVNETGDKYVAWCFKAGGAPTATNTATSGAMTANSVSIDGTLQSAYTPSGSPDIYPEKMSINTKLGFSIVRYDGSNAQETFPHGLGQKPELVIFKRINTAASWLVTDGTRMGYLDLNSSLTTTRHNQYIASMDANTIEVKDVAGINDSGDEIIAYCFASKRGVSKVGSYTGTGAAGNKVYTGFEPAWVMIKNADSTGAWNIMDNKRDTDNPREKNLWADTADTEATATQSNVYDLDFDRDGFTVQNHYNPFNKNGDTIIYLAFAKNTKETSLVDDTDLELHLDPSSYSGSGSTWTADTGSDATISGASYDEELGDWFDFDGTNDKITASGAAGLTFGDSATYSVEMWFKSNLDTGYRRLYSTIGAGGGAKNQNAVSISSTKEVHIYYTSGTGTSVNRKQTAANAFEDNKWNHLVVTQNGTTIKCYINGNDISLSTGSTTTISQGSDIIFGSHGTGYATYYRGQISQIRLYSTVLTESQIRQNYNFTKNDYPDGSNQTIDGATFTAGTGGNPDVFRFDGVNDSISLDDRTASNSKTGSDLKGFTGGDNTDYTISLYINTADTGGNSTFGQPIIGYTNSDVYAALSMKDGKFTYSHYNGSWNHKKSTTSINDSEWHHCVFVHRNDATIDIYVDGTKEVDNVSATLTSGRYFIAKTIGKGYDGEYIDMDFGHLKMYDRALTSSEVTSEFNNTKSTYGL